MKKSILNFAELTRAYSLPLSISSWFVALCFAYPAAALRDVVLTFITIICLHMGGNLFDDLIDVKNELKKNGGDLSKVNFNIGSNKAHLILDGTFTFQNVYFILFVLFAIPFIIGLFYTVTIGLIIPVLALIILGICMFYPYSSKYKAGDLIISFLTGPMVIYCTYLALTSYYYFKKPFYSLGFFSISIFLMILGFCFVHTLMDWEHDEARGKMTLVRLIGDKQNALRVLGIIISLAYLNVIYLAILGVLPKMFLLILITLPISIELVKSMYNYINIIDAPLKPKWYLGPMENWEEIEKTGNKYFMYRFLLGRNTLLAFSVISGIIALIFMNY